MTRLIDRIFGRKPETPDLPLPSGTSIEDARAVERYERMIRTAPAGVIERAHVEAFERLTPAQLDLLFARLTADAQHDDERPADAAPAELARSATRAERRRPGALSRSLDGAPARTDASAPAGADAGVWAAASMFDAIAWYAIASVAWTAWAGSADPAPDDTTAHAADVDGSDAGDAAGGGGGADAGDFWDFGF
ncbi:hypothetical protein ABIQ69_00145 [Agromyces sp. G08B096]|uniref:DUF1707 domain-containing protein n=1 Tax=Agromyces sp. G08B096 TaxID=3156399 RepID=A0AAU7WA91_9MICO